MAIITSHKCPFNEAQFYRLTKAPGTSLMVARKRQGDWRLVDW
ncbi:MAG TPA: hypothetical protein PLD25_14545 [Chloroflexota bacterium]|nr:hypothetical protein [Chloroflexota bacterium]HUM71589.1 hypothetical protein [Chloroflexota bacterium]